MSEKYIKRFLEWTHRKQQLELQTYKRPHFSEGEIWWCSIGENIGVEICGKGIKFCRPVIIFRKFGNRSFLGIPLTTKSVRQRLWEVHFNYGNISQVALLNQMRVFSYKRLDGRMGEMSTKDFTKVKEVLVHLLTL